MKTRHLLTLRDLNPSEIGELFKTAAKLKRNRKEICPLAGKTIGLLFQKPSVRTRVSFEVGMAQLGGRSLYIGPVELQEGQRESPKDVALVLSRTLDGIVARTFSHQQAEELARWAKIPVINGLSDFAHPCQALSDLFTLQEKFRRLKGLRVAFVGDGNNVCHSLIECCALLGIHLKIASPRDYRPDNGILRWALTQARRFRSQTLLFDKPGEAVRGAQVVYTDVWTSMGQEKEQAQRRSDFQGFQVNSSLMQQAAKGALFMHCLPAHRGEEVTDEVMDSRSSIVYDQAENRLHVQKAILLMLLGKKS